MATQVECVKLAQSLPPVLLRFFTRYPPLLKSAANPTDTASSAITSRSTLPSDPNANRDRSLYETSIAPSDLPNPFKSHKYPVTGRWHDPVYSLRRQADLVKLARAHGVEELLPYTVKGTHERTKRREEQGLQVKGTGVGQKVKGKQRERTMKGRLERRKQAMLEMPAMIQQWKQVS